MKSVYMAFLLLFFQTCYGQIAHNTESLNDSNVYNLALSEYIDLGVASSHRHCDTLFVEGEYSITSTLKQTTPTTKIIVVADQFEIFGRKHFTRKTIHRIYPLAFDGEHFYVSFVPFGVSGKAKGRKRYLTYSNGGGCRIYFKCDKDGLHYIKKECSWI